ncbi:hypothetical protein QTP70_013427, partial [Hemibagrus guttatus]
GSTAPSVSLLPPSPLQLSEGSASLLCLLSGYSPQGALVSWTVDGSEVKNGVLTSLEQEKSGRYSRSSTLTLSKDLWEKGEEFSWKGRELTDVMERRKVDILCVQETRWKGSKACSIGAGFKLFYYGVDSKRNGVGVVLKEEFVRNVLEVKRVSDRVMSLKLEIEGVMLNVVSGYAPQVGCELEEKERFWSELDEVMESIPTGERVVIGADFNGHVGEGNTGDEEVMGKFGVKERNLEGQMVVDFAKRMDMGVVNTYFQKREEHRVTYKSGDLEKAYDRVPREGLWYCMRKSGAAEKYVRVVQDMYERSRTVVRCAVGQTEEFKVEVGLHQGSALSPFLFAIVMDQLSEEVRQESPCTMMFADDIVICSESREQVEENLGRWRSPCTKKLCFSQDALRLLRYLLQEPTEEARLIKDKPIPAGHVGTKVGGACQAKRSCCGPSERGDASDKREVFGEYILHFGKYKGKSFRCLLENDMGYTIYLMKNLLQEEAAGVFTTEGPSKISLLSLVPRV